nr:MAG TPA: hypothetical protein [Caudoviricetes sp.]
MSFNDIKHCNARAAPFRMPPFVLPPLFPRRGSVAFLWLRLRV